MANEDTAHRFRRAFRGAAGYLDTANFGLVATPVAERVRRLMRELTEAPDVGTSRYEALEAHGARARAALAAVVGASPDELALVESTTHGLQTAADAIGLRPGDEVLVASWDFVGARMAWSVGHDGVTVREVDVSGTDDPAGRLAEAIGPATRVVCTSSVTEAHGERLPAADLARECRARGVWLVLDAIQEAGARTMALSASGIDVATGGGHKWLGCPFGVGWLYVSRDRWNELRLPRLGYLGLRPPDEGWERYLSSGGGALPIAPVSGLSRLEPGGTPNFPGRMAMAEAAGLLVSTGVPAVERAIDSLTSDLIDRLDDAGAPLVTPRAPSRRAGIVCVTLGGRAADARAIRALGRRGITATQRYAGGVGGIRLALHAYNTARDVRAAADVLAPLVRRARSTSTRTSTPARSRRRAAKEL